MEPVLLIIRLHKEGRGCSNSLNHYLGLIVLFHLQSCRKNVGSDASVDPFDLQVFGLSPDPCAGIPPPAIGASFLGLLPVGRVPHRLCHCLGTTTPVLTTPSTRCMGC